MKNNESMEMYLETILKLAETSNNVHSIDVANEMNFSKPSVSRAMKLLKEQDFIKIDKSGAITLTEAGKERAAKVYERHCILTKIFEILGAPAKLAETDACRIEHYISDELFQIIKKHVESHMPPRSDK